MRPKLLYKNVLESTLNMYICMFNRGRAPLLTAAWWLLMVTLYEVTGTVEAWEPAHLVHQRVAQRERRRSLLQTVELPSLLMPDPDCPCIENVAEFMNSTVPEVLAAPPGLCPGLSDGLVCLDPDYGEVNMIFSEKLQDVQ